MCFFVLPLYVVFAVIGPTFEAKDSSATTHNFEIPSVSISTIDDFSLEVAPDEYDSDSHSFTVSTTNYTGYTLSLKTTGQTRELVNTSDSTKMVPTVSLPAGQQSVVADDLSGYGYSMDGARYKPVPNPGASAVVRTKDSAGSDTLSLTFGARVNIEIPEGEYTNDFALTVSANDGGYFIAYDENTPAVVSNMPNPNPEEGRVTGLKIRLSDRRPVRSGYRFLGWSENKNATTATYQPGDDYQISSTSTAVVFLYAVWAELDQYVINYDGNFADSGSMDSQLVHVNTPVTLRKNTFTRDGYIFVGWSKSKYNAYITYVDEDEVTNASDGYEEVTLYAIWQGENVSYFSSPNCVFNGQNHDVVGECAQGQHVDFINTGITPFTMDNINRDFVLEFTINSVTDAGVTDRRDTIFNLKLENEDDETGHYPGIVMRVHDNNNKKIELTGRDGKSDSKVSVYKSINELIGVPIKIIRYRGNIYYKFGDEETKFLVDLSTPSVYFNTALTFGANLQPGNKLPDRFFRGELSDINFHYDDSEKTYRDFVYDGNFVEPTDTPTFPTVFHIPTTCIFNGDALITGECTDVINSTDFTNAKTIDTGLQLLTSTGFEKDFDIYFEIEFDSKTQPKINGSTQNTILNIKSEDSDLGYPGIVLRKRGDNAELGTRMTDHNKNLNISDNFDSFRLVKKGTVVCYSMNGMPLKAAHDFAGFDQFVSDTLLLGSSADKNGTPWRFIVGKMSNIRIRVGKITDADNLDCQSN